MSKTETLAFRLDTEQKREIEKLSAQFGLLPADIVRAAVQAVLVAVKANGGKIELPLHVRTRAEEDTWKVIARKVLAVSNEFTESKPGEDEALKELLLFLLAYAEQAKLHTNQIKSGIVDMHRDIDGKTTDEILLKIEMYAQMEQSIERQEKTGKRGLK